MRRHGLRASRLGPVVRETLARLIILRYMAQVSCRCASPGRCRFCAARLYLDRVVLPCVGRVPDLTRAGRA